MGVGLLVGVGLVGACAGWVNVTVIVLLVTLFTRRGFTNWVRSFTVGLFGSFTCLRYLPFLLVLALLTVTHFLAFLRSMMTLAFATGFFLTFAAPLIITASPVTGLTFGPLIVSLILPRLPASTAAALPPASAASAVPVGAISPAPNAKTPAVAKRTRRMEISPACCR